MSRHEGVSCDACLKSNFRGRRFKCLICYDYDLCASCYEENASSSRHLPDHPMQCILTRSDFELYYGGEVLSAEQPQSFTCPYCNKMGLTDAALCEHVGQDHTDASIEVVCPVCAAVQGGDPNFLTDDFAGHLTLEHRSGQRDLISFLDEPSAIRHGGVRRIPHSGRALGGPRSRRSNMHFSSSGALSTLSPSGRESVDPITELLSHLTSVRRGPQSTQLQQLQMQIQLERQQITAARQQLERLPRRQAHPVVSSSSAASSTTATNASTFNGLASGHQQLNGNASNGISISNFSQIPIASSIHGVASSAANGVAGGSQTQQVNASSSAASVAAASGGGQAANNQSQFLLARFMTSPLDEKAQAELEIDRADRSQFVQALILSTIANLEAFRVDEGHQLGQTEEDSDQQTDEENRVSSTAAVTDSSGTTTVVGGGGADGGEQDMDNNSSKTSTSNHNNNNNAVNKKFDEDGGNNNTISDRRIPVMQQPSSVVVKPKPPTATKPVPHNLPNHHERGAGRGAGMGGGRPPPSVKARQQQQQQSQPNSGPQSHVSGASSSASSTPR